MSMFYQVVEICDNCNENPVILKQGLTINDIKGDLPNILEKDFESSDSYYEHICKSCKSFLKDR